MQTGTTGKRMRQWRGLALLLVLLAILSAGLYGWNHRRTLPTAYQITLLEAGERRDPTVSGLGPSAPDRYRVRVTQPEARTFEFTFFADYGGAIIKTVPPVRVQGKTPAECAAAFLRGESAPVEEAPPNRR